MRIFNIIFWFGIFINLDADATSSQRVSSPSLNPLHGKHLRVVWPKWVGNPKGLSGPPKGDLILDYMAARFHFTYEFVRVTENWLEPINQSIRGQFSYLWDDEADLLMAQIFPRSGRHNIVDLSSCYTYDTMSLLIPVSNDVSSNTKAVIKPFQWPVWLLLFVSIISVTYFFRQIQKFLLSKLITRMKNSDQRAQIKSINPYLYVFGNVLSQGGTYTVNRLPMRLIAGVWILAAFVFVQAYNSTLITYVLAPTNRPLVTSFHGLAESSDAVFWLKKSGTIENMLFLTKNDDHLLIKLRSRVSSSPESRCTLVSECVGQVKPGTTNVYSDSSMNLMYIIKERFLKTGKCDVEIVGNDFLSLMATFALQKNSPYTSTISKGVNELRENGLTNYWDVSRAFPPQCTANVRGLATQEVKNDGPRRLSLRNLTGAFVVLLIGIGISFSVFLGELISKFGKK